MTTEPTTANTTPIVCDMTDAPDTPAERMSEWGRLYARSLVGRERTAHGIRFRFRADDGVERWVRDLTAREQACCPFLDLAVTAGDGYVWWHVGVIDGVDDDIARTILDDLYTMPDTTDAGVAGIEERLMWVHPTTAGG